MSRVCAGLATVAAAVVAFAVPAARASVSTRCAPVAVQFTAASERWVYTIEASGVACPAARAVAEREATQPWTGGGEGWRCTIGTDAASWAFSCTHGAAVVRAFGPTLESGSWADVARRLPMTVLEPGVTPGLAFDGIAGQERCEGVRSPSPWLFAKYSGPGGATLTIAEGKPEPCGSLGLAPKVAVWHVHGHAAELLENCAPSGCARLEGAYVLTWREHGVTVTLLTTGVDQTMLLAIARSLHPVR